MEREHWDSDGPQPWDGFLVSASRPLQTQELSFFAGKRVLITGAGGYLGSALARRLSGLPVAELVLLDQSEFGLYRLGDELYMQPAPRLVVGSVLDRALLQEIFQRHAPQLVLHAAALKHVPLMEENPLAAAETNALGTAALVEAVLRAGVERFLLLSTDKAVDPINVMGATKRIAEQVVLRAGEAATGIFTVARLCNVLGSTGSVAPLFARQVDSGGPVTLTDADATRFFLSRADAVDFLLRAGTQPTISGLVVPSLDEARRVKALAEYLMQRASSGRRDVVLVETGLRPGDKQHERLTSAAETTRQMAGGALVMVDTDFDRTRLAEALRKMQRAVRERDAGLLVRALKHALPEYSGHNVRVDKGAKP